MTVTVKSKGSLKPLPKSIDVLPTEPSVKLTATKAIGTTTKQAKASNALIETQEVVKEQVFTGPTANVGMSIGVTRNLGNYESVKYTVSLFMPSNPDQASIESTFNEVKGWVDQRVEMMNQEINDQLEH